MSKLQRSRLARLLLLAMAAFPAVVALGGGSSPEAARLDTFAKDGTNYFALALKLADVPPDAAPRDVTIVFDTSASQMGAYRANALLALNALVAGLPPTDRVRLLAADLDATPLTSQFVAPNSPEWAAAVAKLIARVPLGTTDMEKVLQAVAAGFADSKNPRSAVYIGQGRSPANILTPDQFQKLSASLTGAKIPVCSYAIGPRVDLQLLGALAASTGGQLISEAQQMQAAQRAGQPQDEEAARSLAADAGRQLAAAARATVLWPTAATWPQAMSEVLPKTPPPLRSDRDTVVIGTYKGPGPMEVKLTVDTSAGPRNLAWTVQPTPSNPDNNYLAVLVESARSDGGASLPMVGSASLKLAAQELGGDVQNLIRLATMALRMGNKADAARMADAVLNRDPGNIEAVAIKHAAEKKGIPVRPISAQVPPGPADLNLVGPPPAPAPGAPPEAVPAGAPGLQPAGPANPFGGEGALALSADRERRMLTQVIQAEVQNTLNQARALMGTDPAAALQNLRLKREELRQVRDLPPDIRDQLVDALEGALREGARRVGEEEQRRLRRQEASVAAKERQLLNENLLRSQAKLQQLMARFDALMKEGHYRDAEDFPAAEAGRMVESDPKMMTTIPTVLNATLNARFVGNWQLMQQYRIAKTKTFFDTLATIEKAAIPFPDEPPIVYPEARVWQELTARRREKYKSMDLATKGPAEKKIQEELHKATQMEFIDMPLTDVVDYLKERHGIQIQLDKKALEEVGVQPDVAITKNVQGISLRSALKLLLGDLDLVYMVKNEVLLITTKDRVEGPDGLTTKVYPVADLVLRIRPPAFSGGFGGLGGMGGMGAGMGMGGGGGMGGQFGGGGGGGMGGGMGGGGMGGGGGMFNIPPEKLPRVPAAGL